MRKIDTKIQQHTHTLAADNQRKNILSSSIQRLSQEIMIHQTEQDKSELTRIASYLGERSALNILIAILLPLIIIALV
ncbi:hypothetical protein [Psychrobacter sp. WY6]|uniref:hypothetical protein n=1 Tax=Psychrobacter sp. WY6 TaxID=2708350 RepID=UPI002023142B|nr:hypothetical protein [Psychrobacter sp. WY6]